MPRTHDDDDDIVADGTVLHVPFYDSARGRMIAADSDNRPYVVDSRRPGAPWVVDTRRAPTAAQTHDARQALADAYAAYDTADANRWRNPPNGPTRDQSMNYTGGDPVETGHGAPGRGHNKIPAGAYVPGPGYREGDQCTINGAPGTLVKQGGYLVCRPTSADARRLVKQSHYDPMGRLEGTSHYEYEEHPDDDEHDQSTDSVADAQRRLADARWQAYAAYDAEQSQAWRAPK
jgi:hypothetical protein